MCRNRKVGNALQVLDVALPPGRSSGYILSNTPGRKGLQKPSQQLQHRLGNAIPSRTGDVPGGVERSNGHSPEIRQKQRMSAFCLNYEHFSSRFLSCLPEKINQDCKVHQATSRCCKQFDPHRASAEPEQRRLRLQSKALFPFPLMSLLWPPQLLDVLMWNSWTADWERRSKAGLCQDQSGEACRTNKLPLRHAQR